MPSQGRKTGDGRVAHRANGASRAREEAAPRTHAGVMGRVGWAVLAAGWLFLLLSVMSFDAGDAPSHAVWPHNEVTANWMGPVGAHLAYALLKLLGWGVWPGLAAGLLGIAMPLARQRPEHPLVRSLGLCLVIAAAAAVAQVLLPASGPLPQMSGGMLGVVIAEELRQRFNPGGTLFWLAVAVLVGLIISFDRMVLTVPAWLLRHAFAGGRQVGVAAGQAAGAVAGATAEGSRSLWSALSGGLLGGGRLGSGRGAGARSKNARPRAHDLEEAEAELRAGKRGLVKRKAKPIDERAGGLGATEAFDPDEAELDDAELDEAETDTETDETWDDAEAEAADAEEEADDDDDDWDEEEDDEDDADEEDWDEDEDDQDDDAEASADPDAEHDPEHEDAPGAPQVFDRDKLREKIGMLPVRFAAANRQTATEADLENFQNAAELQGYKFPGLDLLEEPEENFNVELEAYVREQAEALESALREYKINGSVEGIESGPVITLYHVKLAPGTKVAALNAVSSDLARSLKAINIRIVPNMVGRDTVAIEVPNAKKEKVRLKELMSNRSLFEKMKLPMFLGKDASGEPLIGDLTKMPHVLIAGTTGSGKSVCMNTIVMSFLYTKKPNELKLVLVDPKMVEMSQFKDIPHLMCPVVTEMSKAAAILEWAVGKMDERYELLAEAGCRDIAAYNELEWEELRERFTPPGTPAGAGLTPEEESRIPRKLPYMVFIIDELADLMMTNKEVEGSIVRIAQKARAVGIHLILATQRPQANVVTGLIKGNMPCRITFKVASGLDSRIVLDQKGGELLLGQGDMLFLSPSSHKLNRAQGTLVDDKEIRRVVKFMKEVAAPTFERQLVQIRHGATSDEDRLVASENNSSASLAAAQEDPLFDRAVEIVLETKRGSVSLLQRRLAIGYTRASRLIDLMGIAGIIGEHKGSVAREVMITPQEWDAIKAMAEEMAREQGIVYPRIESAEEQGVLFAGGQSDTHEAEADTAEDTAGLAEHDAEDTEDPADAEAATDLDPNDEADVETDDEADEEADEETDEDASDEAADDDEEDGEWEWVYEDEEDAEDAEDAEDDEGEEHEEAAEAPRPAPKAAPRSAPASPQPKPTAAAPKPPAQAPAPRPRPRDAGDEPPFEPTDRRKGPSRG